MLETENSELRSRDWYRPRYPDDPIDIAVCKVMQQMKIPVKMDFRRISPGVYMGDQRVVVTVSNGQVLVRRAGTYVPLVKYLEELHYPMLVAKFGPEAALQYLVRRGVPFLCVLD